jgi:hypothetical protein
VISRHLIRPVSIALTAVGTILVAFAVVYLAVRASHLPAFLPGHLARRVGKTGHVIRTHAHVKLGVALMLVAIASFAAAWWVAFRYEPVD